MCLLKFTTHFVQRRSSVFTGEHVYVCTLSAHDQFSHTISTMRKSIEWKMVYWMRVKWHIDNSISNSRGPKFWIKSWFCWFKIKYDLLDRKTTKIRRFPSNFSFFHTRVNSWSIWYGIAAAHMPLLLGSECILAHILRVLVFFGDDELFVQQPQQTLWTVR